MMINTTRAFLAGLLGHVFIELGARIFFAQQNAKIPLVGAGINLFLFIAAGIIFDEIFGAAGIALADAIAFSGQALFLIGSYKYQKSREMQSKPNWWLPGQLQGKTFIKALIGSALGTLAAILVSGILPVNTHGLIAGIITSMAGILTILPFILPEIQLLLHL